MKTRIKVKLTPEIQGKGEGQHPLIFMAHVLELSEFAIHGVLW